MNLDQNENNGGQLFFVQQVAMEKNLFAKLEYTETIIYSLDEDIKKRVNSAKMLKYLEDLHSDRDFIRKLEYVCTIKENVETAIEYFGFDYLSNPDFNFERDVEIRIREIRKELAIFFGKLIKEMQKGVELEL